MELGQVIFGNVMKQYEADWAGDGLGMLAEVLKEHLGESQSTSGYGYHFNNQVFTMRPYYWGDCECGFEELESMWDEDNHHAPDCYQTALQAKHYGKDYDKTWQLPKGHSYDDKCMESLAKEWGLPEQGCAVHCTCDHRVKYHEWRAANNHKPDCGVVAPNFLYKPTGVEINWYKYIGRGMTCNKQQPSATRWFEVLAECVASIKGENK